jgi:hypothetical protein
MTPAEHRLLVEMFKQQTLAYAALVEVLKSRDILSDGDLEAADALVSSSSRLALEQNVVEEYRGIAKIVGVQTDLPDVIG